MKLVDILARELKVWPNDQYESIGQADNGSLHKQPNWKVGCGWSKERYTRAEDWEIAHVTRAQWQSAVDALKAGENLDRAMSYVESNLGDFRYEASRTEKLLAWNGDGLPPVGAVCEYLTMDAGEYWCKAVVEFIGSHWVLVGYTHPPEGPSEAGVNHVLLNGDLSSRLRPIRTPEQIAAEERQGAIHEMVDHLKRWSSVQELCGHLYDAGYRKFEMVDN